MAYQQSLALKETCPLPDISNLPVLQQIALLRTIEKHTARLVIGRLKQITDCQAQPGFLEYRALVARGWMEQKPGYRLHTATAIGRLAAEQLFLTLWTDLHMAQIVTKQSMPSGHYRYERW